MNDINITDKDGRRKDIDRRQFTYTFHLPERRNGIDRRGGLERRRSNRQDMGE